jgi:hypothetical protein
MRRWGVRLLAVAFVASLVTLCAKGSRVFVRAVEMLPRAYFPIVYKAEPVRYDDFQDQVPVWQYKFREAKDGSFFYRSGRLVALIEDNRANNIAWPGWRPLADFKLEVDARFSDGEWLNGLGLIFGGNDSWTEYYAFMLGYNFKQHYWSVARVEPRVISSASMESSDLVRPADMIPRAYFPIVYRAEPVRYDDRDVDYHWLLDTHSGWGGTPPDVQWYSRWNHLMVIRVGDTIDVYVNGFHMPHGTFTDGAYGRNRLVGLLATSYEWSKGEVEFDNFQLTPLSMP